MKLNKISLAALLALSAISTAQAANTIKWTGTVAEASCSIQDGSADQDLSLGLISIKALDAGTIEPSPFSIQLTGCAFKAGTLPTDPVTLNNVKVTFNGNESLGTPGALSLGNEVQGASLQLMENDGTSILLGKAAKPVKLEEGSNTLRFKAQVVKDAGGTLVGGNIAAQANFQLAYE